jgi:hypothetical protein
VEVVVDGDVVLEAIAFEIGLDRSNQGATAYGTDRAASFHDIAIVTQCGDDLLDGECAVV